MPRPQRSVLRTPDELVAEAEEKLGAVPASDVLQICKYYRYLDQTVRAQKSVIEGHARKIAELSRRT